MSSVLTPSLEGILKTHSRVLSEEVRQHPEWLEDLRRGGDLDRDYWREDYAALISELPFSQQDLVEFRRKCLLRILLRDVLGHANLGQTTAEISALADAVLDWTYFHIRAEAERLYGVPRLPDGSVCGCSILSLGKLGGLELNYSSDIDLMYVYSGRGESDGARALSNKEFFEKLAQRQTRFLGAYTEEGICYRVDLRLRPEGSLGEIAQSLEACKEYYRGRARDWELQMMIKARVSAGEPEAGAELIEFIEPLTYGTTIDFSAIEAVSATRLRINEKLSSRKLRSDALDVKLTRGGIRDIEFLVQCLQRLHGGREPWVRHGGTMLALSRLYDKSMISSGEYLQLGEAYEFLRHLEHRLQVMEDLQTHTLPESMEDIEDLARRMPALELGMENTGSRLIQRLKRHLEAVEQIYGRVIYGRPPIQWPEARAVAGRVEVPLQLQRRLEGRKLLGWMGAAPAGRNWAQLDLLLDKLEPHLEAMDGDEALARDVFDIAAHSPFLTDELIRQPEWIEELAGIRRGSERAADWSLAGGLRREYRRLMFRIQSESLCLRRPVFETLSANSDLADEVIRQAYALALRDVAKGEKIGPEMMVVALGRLGMREFDVASDADLLFILPTERKESLEFWTRVAARMIELLTAYTGEGAIFTVDARLRPFGREGDLVQVEQTYLDYFAQQAQAWEGIAYMKARAVAGNVERATGFLIELQQLDWRRYGQSHRSRKQLRDMRARLENEQGKSSPLKAGRGGYYDIDFSLMFLRLRGAGIFFKVLNTPERIEVIEKMGHLEREDALFLRKAATLYRAVDHGMRMYSGQAAAFLPSTSPAMEPVADMVGRWMPELGQGESLAKLFLRIQEQTRETFERLFA